MVKNRIKEILEEKEKSLNWLHFEAKIPYQTLHKIYKNQTESIRFETLLKIMKALEIKSFDEILYDDEDNKETDK